MKRIAFLSSLQLDPFGDIKGQTEMSVAQGITELAAAKLAEYGYTVRLFIDKRGDDDPATPDTKFDHLIEQADLAREWHPDLLLSLHHDWTGTKQRDGVRACCGPGMGERADKLARLIAEETGFKHQLVWADYGGYIIPKRGGIIIELGEYGTHDEAQYLMDHQEELGEGVARAIHRFYGGHPEEDDLVALDKVTPTTYLPEWQRLQKANILGPNHAPEDAASVGLLITLCGRLLSRVEALEGELKEVKK